MCVSVFRGRRKRACGYGTLSTVYLRKMVMEVAVNDCSRARAVLVVRVPDVEVVAEDDEDRGYVGEHCSLQYSRSTHPRWQAAAYESRNKS